MAEVLNSIIPNVMLRSGQLQQAFVETLQMVGITGVLALLLGIPFGVLLYTTRTGGILQNRPIHFILNKFCDIFRSIPFILLAIILLGLSRLIMGTAIGVKGAIIPLLIATIPFLGRQVEGALAEVPEGLVEAAQAMGCSPWEIIWRVYLKEGTPGIARGVTITLISLINFTAIAGAFGAGGLGNFAISYGGNRLQMDIAWGVTITLISLINFTAIAGAIGAGGLGSFAISYGHGKNLPDVMWTVLLIIIIMVSLVQAIGNAVVKKTTH